MDSLFDVKIVKAFSKKTGKSYEKLVVTYFEEGQEPYVLNMFLNSDQSRILSKVPRNFDE